MTITGFRVIISTARMLSRFLPCLIALRISTAVTMPMTLILLSITGKPLKFPSYRMDTSHQSNYYFYIRNAFLIYYFSEYALGSLFFYLHKVWCFPVWLVNHVFVPQPPKEEFDTVKIIIPSCDPLSFWILFFGIFEQLHPLILLLEFVDVCPSRRGLTKL